MNPVLESAEFVAKNAHDVAINRKHYRDFEKYRDLLGTGTESRANTDDITFRMLFAALNFCFWNWDISKSGNSNIAMTKLRTLYEKGLLNEYYELDFETFQSEFSQFYLLEERYAFIQDMILFIKSQTDGLVAYFNSFNDLKSLIEDMLKRLPQFRDISEYEGEKVYFLKRIQALIYSLRNEITSFDVTEGLTALADYRIPQFLNTIGILDYSPELAMKIAMNEEIPHGSSEEIEIRACMIVALNELSEITGLPASVLDSIIWSGSNKLKYRNPFHRTVNTDY